MTLLLVTFLGLSFATLLWGFLGAFALTTLLYILRLRRRRVAVAFLGLWEKSLVERKASALRSRMQRLLSLLLSLLLVGALVFALGDPRPDVEEETGRSIVVVLDVSASMAGKSEGGSRIADAKKLVTSWFSGLGPGDQMLLIEMGAAPRPLSGLTSDRQALALALDDALVLDVDADLPAALELGRDALRGKERSQIIVVSDGALDELGAALPSNLPPVSFSPVGVAEDGEPENVGVTAFSARRYPLSGDRFEVLIELSNSGTKPALVEIALYEAKPDGGRGTQLDLHRIALEPKGSVSQSYENLDHAQDGLIAEVRRVDGVAEEFLGDNIARTLLAPRIPARILLVGPANNFLDAALLVEESLTVERISVGAYPPSGEFDVTIFDGVFPGRESRTGAALYLGAAPEGASPDSYPAARGEELELFGFDTWAKDSTVFRLIDPYDVQVLTGVSLKPQNGDTVLGASAGRPIFISGERPEGRFLALGFSPSDSDFVLRTAWPLFVLNIIDELFPRGRTDAVLGLQTGTLWRPPILAQEGDVKVRGPLPFSENEVRTVPVEQGRAVLFGQRAGFYEVVSPQGTSKFAASLLHTKEGLLSASSELKLGEKALPKVSGMEPRTDHKPWFWLLLGVFAVSFGEWWAYHKRWTV